MGGGGGFFFFLSDAWDGFGCLQDSGWSRRWSEQLHALQHPNGPGLMFARAPKTILLRFGLQVVCFRALRPRNAMFDNVLKYR